MNKPFLKVKSMSELTGFSASMLRRLAKEGVIPAYRINGRDYLFDADEVIETIRKHRV